MDLRTITKMTLWKVTVSTYSQLGTSSQNTEDFYFAAPEHMRVDKITEAVRAYVQKSNLILSGEIKLMMQNEMPTFGLLNVSLKQIKEAEDAERPAR
jgi:ATP-dependent DNA ligase